MRGPCARRRLGFALILTTISVRAGTGTDETATLVAGGTAGITESPNKLFMQIVERHNAKDKNFGNNLSCREVFTGNGYRRGRGGTTAVSQQYMAVMGLSFLRQACRCDDSPVRQHLAKPPVSQSTNDVLTQTRFHVNGPPADEKSAMVNEFAVLYTLGQRESNGDFDEGRDITMKNIFVKKRQWEAGAFQTSADSLALDATKGSSNVSRTLGVGPPLTKQVMANYLQVLAASPSPTDRRLACDLPVLGGARGTGIDVTGEDLDDLFGRRGYCSRALAGTRVGASFDPAKIDSHDGDVVNCFRGLSKNCPAFAIEYAAVTTRINRQHWGPLRKLGTETDFQRPYIVPACTQFFADLYDHRDKFCELTTGRQEVPPTHVAELPAASLPPGVPPPTAPGAPAVVTPPASPPVEIDFAGLQNPGAAGNGTPVAAPPGGAAVDHNAGVVAAQKKIRSGGKYTLANSAVEHLARAAKYENGKLVVDGSAATVTDGHCATGTYLDFLQTFADLQAAGKVNITPETGKVLMANATYRDGYSVWGRWNGNGPGTAMLFKELELGTNFVDPQLDGKIADAVTREPKEGDFMKVFWKESGTGEEAVGKTEAGHSVVFKNYVKDANGAISQICYWSVNQGQGFGEKCVDRSRVVHAIFSRLEHPENINNAPALVAKTPTNPYLQRIGNRPGDARANQSSSYETALREVGIIK